MLQSQIQNNQFDQQQQEMEEAEASNINYNILYCLYLPTTLYYCIFSSYDDRSNFILFIALAILTSVLKKHQKKLLFVQQFIVLLDFLLKVFVYFNIYSLREKQYFQDPILDSILAFNNESVNLKTISYLGTLITCNILPFLYIERKKISNTHSDYETFLKTISNLLDFITPILIYSLGFTKLSSKSFREWVQQLSPEQSLSNIDMFQQVAWSLATALFLIFHKNKFYLRKCLTIMILVFIIRDHVTLKNSPQLNLYNLNENHINIIKVCIIIFFRIHNQTQHIHQAEESEDEQASNNRMSSYKKYTLKRKLTLKASRNHILVIILIVLTIITLVLTNGLGNFIVIIGIFINVPSYKQESFRSFIAIGVTISFILQPNQFIYFVFLYIARYISTSDQVFQKKNWWIFIEVGRLIILLGKVSVLNFLIGLFQSQLLVIFTIVFRDISSFFKYILVFMGTQDNYQYYVEYFIPKSIYTDIILWVQFLLLRTYSPSSTIKFKGTNVTNIFLEYPLIKRFQNLLKVLKIFHWVAYIAISLMILNSPPCLFTLMRIIPLLSAFIVGLFQSHRSQWSQRLWSWNFYTSFIIVFIKYFYLLSKYDNLSPWLIAILEPLEKNHQFIGLQPPDHSFLLISLGPDCLVIIINAIVLFVFSVEISESNYKMLKEQIYQQNQLARPLTEISEDQQANIEYLYKKYIEPVSFNFKQSSKLRPYLADFLLDICLILFLIVTYLVPKGHYTVTYFPYYLLFFFGFLLQKGKHYYKHFFKIWIGISSFDLLTIYATYFWNMIYKDEQQSYSLSLILSKYSLLIISVIFNELHESILKFYKENEAIKKKQRQFLVFKLLAPLIPNDKLKRQVIILYVNLFKVITFSVYITMIVFGNKQVRYTLAFGVLIFIVVLVFKPDSRAAFKYSWVYCVYAVILFLLWTQNSIIYLLLVSARGYYMLTQQFDDHIYMLKSGNTNRTSNDEMKKRVEEVEFKFEIENRLESISEVRSIRQLQSYLSYGQEQIIWREQNFYSSVIWLMPMILQALIILGVLNYCEGGVGFILLSLTLIGIMYIIKNLQNWSVSSRFVCIIMFIVLLGISLTILNDNFLNYMPYEQEGPRRSIGLFLILVGQIGYYYLWKYIDKESSPKDFEYSYFIDFSEKRSKQAQSYWKKKSELVSSLGSQIHNQKKMASLKKIFVHLENLGIKVEQLSQELKEKSVHRKEHFQNLQKIQSLQEDKAVFKRQQFEVYSNMLTFMSMEDLQYCYLNLNLYCKVDNFMDSDLLKTASSLQQWVLSNFNGTLCDSISTYNQQKYSSAIKNKQISAVLQKIQQIQQEVQKAEDEQNQSDIQQKEEEEIKQDDLIKQEIDKPRKRMQKQSSSSKYKKRNQIEVKNVKDYCSERIDLRLSQLSWLTRKIIQNIQILGLIIIAGWNFFGGVYTIPTNIAVFSWVIVLQTKTTVVFWLVLFIYSSIILSCKLLLSYLPKHFFINFIFYYHAHDYFYQYIIIVVCIIEIILLKLGGASQTVYWQRENIFDAFYRSLLNQASKGIRKQKQLQFINIYKHLKVTNSYSFFHRVFSKGRLKPGKDLYPPLAIIQVIILLYIFFFYDMMEFQSKNNRKSLGQILTVSQFSKNMIVALFFQALIMVADRMIVSLNWIDNLHQNLQNFFLNMAFSNDIKYNPLSQDQLKNLSRFDYLLIIKYIFHVILLIFFNFLVYFYIPSGGLQKSIIPQCENSVCGKSYTFLSIFLFLYLIYFVISGLQIKHGFNRNKCRNTLMERYHWIDYYIYMFFTGIPFLWEFKKICDWTITATALPLFHWMKFQDINARMYQSKCESQILKIKPLGKGPWYKFLMGPPGFLFILGLIFSPIIMYSSFNPFAIQDHIVSASFKLQLVMDKYTSYDFFQTSLTTITSDESFEGYNKKILGIFDRANFYKIQASSYPDQIFMLSEPAVLELCSSLRKTYGSRENHIFQLKLVATVTQKVGGSSSIEWGSKRLSNKELELLDKAIIGNDDALQVIDFYSPLPGQFTNRTVLLTNRNNGEYFQLEASRDKMQAPPQRKGPYIFYKSSVKYKVAFGLLTFYLTYVVLVNSLFRMYLTGGIQNIIFEGCELQKILFICEAVRSARILQNFYQEEYLYFSLVDLMRYPRMIKNIAEDFRDLRNPSCQMEKKKIQ